MERNIRSAALALVVVLACAAGANAQPQTKLTSNLGKAMIQAIWCSSLLLEESYIFEEDSDEAVEYEDLAYDLGGRIDSLLDGQGLSEEEIDEIWELFDDAALDYALDDEDAFYVQLAHCEDNYDALLD